MDRREVASQNGAWLGNLVKEVVDSLDFSPKLIKSEDADQAFTLMPENGAAAIHLRAVPGEKLFVDFSVGSADFELEHDSIDDMRVELREMIEAVARGAWRESTWHRGADPYRTLTEVFTASGTVRQRKIGFDWRFWRRSVKTTTQSKAWT